MRRKTWMMLIGATAAATAIGRLARRRRTDRAEADRRDAALEEELDDSFPASDPPSHTATSGARAGSQG